MENMDKKSSGSLQGKLLVAAPSLLDPNFARTVVLLLAHGEHGALGLVLNRPTVTSLSSPCPNGPTSPRRPPSSL